MWANAVFPVSNTMPGTQWAASNSWLDKQTT